MKRRGCLIAIIQAASSYSPKFLYSSTRMEKEKIVRVSGSVLQQAQDILVIEGGKRLAGGDIGEHYVRERLIADLSP